MPFSDFLIVLRWWGTLVLVGAAAYPLTRRLFTSNFLGSGLRKLQGQTPTKQGQTPFVGWWDNGYFFSKAMGMAVVGWMVYAMGTLRLLPFSIASILFALVFVFFLGLVTNFQFKIYNFQSILTFISNSRRKFMEILPLLLLEELFFLLALLIWSWVKAHEPSIRGLEKFMDYGFMQSILNSRFFPPPDMWYAGEPVNYYYFGHLVTAVLTKLSGIDLAYTFNLMLATIFALCFTMSFSIGYQLSVVSDQLSDRLKAESRKLKAIAAGLLTAWLVTFAGNLQTLYAFTRGYTGDNVQPFWKLFWKMGEVGGFRELWRVLGEGMQTYWYANATRFIPFTIHEFPSYSFVVSDVHGHVLSIPFVLLAIGLLIAIFAQSSLRGTEGDAAIPVQSRLLRRMNGVAMTQLIFYGFLVGVLLMTNALDGPIYFALFIGVLVMTNDKWQMANWKALGMKIGAVLGVAGITSLLLLSHFKSFVSGIAVNCPLPILADTKFGPLLFEGVEKCQRSPVWMWLMLWGFFLYCGYWLFYVKKSEIDQKYNPIDRVLKVFFFFSLVLVIVPEFFYFKDIYPAHFRSNTMFKLGYQAFILFSIVSSYAIVKVIRDTKDVIRKRLFLVIILPQFFLVSIYPIFSVRSYFNSLRNYEGIYGLGWIEREYPDDFAAIKWLNSSLIPSEKLGTSTHYSSPFSLVEADGDSYTDYNHFSAFTGIPTVVGWAVHEWLWRGGYEQVSPRREDVAVIYESEDLEKIRVILAKYNVRYIAVGRLERDKFKLLDEEKFDILGHAVFSQGETTIYQIP